MRTIAIMNNKGGVGKTVTAINLADILVRQHGKRVVLVDCDGQANLSRFYLPDVKESDITTLTDCMDGRGCSYWLENLSEIRKNLWLLPADSGLYNLDISIIKGPADPFMLRFLLDLRDSILADDASDFLIFDCPPGFTTASVAALIAAGEVIIPMTMDGFGFYGMDTLRSQIQLLHHAHYSLKISGILITQWHNSDVIHQAEHLLRSQSHTPVFRQVVRRTDKVPESTFDRSPILDYSPTSAAGQDYRAWVKELLGEG